MSPQKKHFVEFLSPGSFYSESSTREVPSWDIAIAVEMANGIQERHNAKPYGFRFNTKLVAEPIPDGMGGTMHVAPKEIAKSEIHFLGGRLIRYDDIPDNRENSILRSNMRCNRWPYVIENNNSWRHTMQFEEGMCIVDADGSVRTRGNDPELAAYRKKKLEDWARERESALA
jgi:hypothetical protein